MRILALSNLYPPHHIGGYALLCQHVLDMLIERGHKVTVLTSTHGVEQEVIEGHVYRALSLESDLHYYQPKQAWLYPFINQKNKQYLQNLVQQIQPDIIFVWGMWALSNQLALEAEKLLPGRVVYYLANPWPIEPSLHQAYWDDAAQNSVKQVLKQIVRIPIRFWLKDEWRDLPIQFQYAPVCSKAQRDQLLEAGVPLQDAPVIYEGIDLGPDLAQADQRNGFGSGDILPLVFVGALVHHKGVHTTIEALSHLSSESLKRVSLTILGAGHPDYEERLRRLVDQYGLSDTVTFLKPIPRDQLPEFLGRFEVLLLPSIWEEPLALIMQEGLANGLVVIGSATGGTKEIIVHGENGLLFPAADAQRLSKHIETLLREPALGNKLSKNGRQTAEKMFSLPRMVDELEAYLAKVKTAAET